MFEAWSRKSKKFNAKQCRRKWDDATDIRQISAGTIFHYAKEADPTWEERYKQTRNENYGPGGPADGGHHARQYTMVWAKDVTIRAKDWEWEGHLLRGAQELTTGMPDLGKSQLHCYFAGIITTTGKKWPDGTPGPTEAANVIMLTAEDTRDQDVVPRLIAAGADLSRVAFLKKIRKDKKERMFLLGEDLDVLEQMIRDIKNVGAVFTDPITAYMGKINSNMTTDVRGQLGPLKDLAEQTNVAFITITHPPKAPSSRAIDHFINSQAFIAAARVGHLCIEEIEIGEDGKPVRDERGQARRTGRNLFSVVRCAGAPKKQTLAYRIDVMPVGQDQKTGQIITAPYLVWDQKAVNVSADQAASNVHAAHEREKKQQSKESAVSFLEDVLANGRC